MIELATLAAAWDADASLGGQPRGQPYTKLLNQLNQLCALRFQPYRNDDLPTYIEKFGAWLEQFDTSDRQVAFLLATKVFFVSIGQFEALQGQLFERFIKKRLLESIIARDGLDSFDYVGALTAFEAEMNATLFIGNSDSSAVNSFVHVNRRYFANRAQRRLVGENLNFWTYAAVRSLSGPPAERAAASAFETSVLATDDHVVGKHRLVVIEDFSGTGSDLCSAVDRLEASALPFPEVLVCPVVATQQAIDRLTAKVAGLMNPRRTYDVESAMILPNTMSCLGVDSYLNEGSPVPDLSARVEALAEKIHANYFQDLAHANRFGFGGLALAFVLFSNCPDNSLPLIWKEARPWLPLFRRVSRII